MDGWTKTYNSSQRFETPFLMLLSESGEMPEMQELFKNNTRDTFTKVVVNQPAVPAAKPSNSAFLCTKALNNRTLIANCFRKNISLTAEK